MRKMVRLTTITFFKFKKNKPGLLLKWVFCIEKLEKRMDFFSKVIGEQVVEMDLVYDQILGLMHF